MKLVNDYSETKIVFRIPDKQPALNFQARWNGAPTQDYPIVRYDPAARARFLSIMRWGLIPAWAKDEKIGYNTINARSEELVGKPSFRNAWKASRRCVVPLTGFYEWKKLGPKEKQPYLVTRKDGQMMGVAGLWEEKKLDGQEMLRSFTICTTSANEFMSELHDRMPVILAQDDFGAWLNEDETAPEAAATMMKPCPEKWLEKVPVDKRMGNVKNWQEEFCQPINSL